ncbi:MAG: hypothetical protein M1823_003374 [Watsoniomyces obsoletus]|nr:MAG: hypothetical protein M1823_003374 [Watsoniomyces obsoletus]
MPGTTLPRISPAEVKRNNTATSCYVTSGSRVYDVTPFMEDHPGGADLILEYAGQDVRKIMGDEMSHTHSEAAYEVLEEYVIGYLDEDVESLGLSKANGKPNGMLENGSSKADVKKPVLEEISEPSVDPTSMMAEKLSVETNVVDDYRKNKFLDLNRPLFMQVWNGGFSKDFYLEQVHKPRHYKSGESAPLFGNFLEPLSKTPWWVVPTLWLPMVGYGTWLARQGMSSWTQVASYWLFGLALWTLVEYGMHRCLFHIDDLLPDNRVFLTLHFVLHGIHHYLPMDRLRLVMPPALFAILATPFWKLVHAIIFWNWYIATAVFCGGIFGYICYDVTHYCLHHRTLPAHYRTLKKYHFQHHYADFQNGFGVTSRFWDRVFGTELLPPTALRTT